MKTLSKIISTITASSLLFVSFTPALVLALDSSSGSGEVKNTVTPPKTDSNTSKCSELDTKFEKSKTTTKENEAKREKNRTLRDQKRLTRNNEWESKQTKSREKWDAARTEEFAKLNELAKSDVQKNAVAKFIDTIKAAIATRRAAHDKANSDFKTGADALIAENKSTVDAAIDTLMGAIETAITKAKADCTAGKSGDLVRSQLKADIALARKTFKETMVANGKLGDKIKLLEKTRKTANDAANKIFKATVESARDELKKVFP